MADAMCSEDVTGTCHHDLCSFLDRNRGPSLVQLSCISLVTIATASQSCSMLGLIGTGTGVQVNLSKITMNTLTKAAVGTVHLAGINCVGSSTVAPGQQ